MRNIAIHYAGGRNLRQIQDEEWRYIPGTDKKYEVSNYGRVKSYCSNSSEKILKPSVTGGFKTVCIRIEGKRKTVLVHKLTAEAFVNRNPNEDMVVHLDWNKGNNHHQNLKWVSRDEGYKRLLERLHQGNRDNPRKRKVTNSKLEKQDIQVLKGMLERGVKQKVIAKLFCISEMQVSRIKRGENWANIEPLGYNPVSA
ncbi:MAG: NUMOD4 domain-containing protein [Salinivirgaceae bacterium]|jgi:hypothetical protein|nr:NUMOD4 domain-containing protein [Salinivirgaceae bacterium]